MSPVSVHSYCLTCERERPILVQVESRKAAKAKSSFDGFEVGRCDLVDLLLNLHGMFKNVASQASRNLIHLSTTTVLQNLDTGVHAQLGRLRGILRALADSAALRLTHDDSSSRADWKTELI